MSDLRHFHYNERTKKRTLYRDNGDGTVDYVHQQDVEPYLEYNKAHKGQGMDRRSDIWHAATIPPIVIVQWLNEGVDIYNPDHADEVKKRLNSSDWAHLRSNEFQL